MTTRFILGYYIKYLAIVLLGLELFFIGIDSLKYVGEFPTSANLIILFFFYSFLYALNYTLPISIILALIIFFIMMIRSNQLEALIALGFSKLRIVQPILLFIIALIIAFIGLNTTSFVYAQENAINIIENSNLAATTNDLMVKYDDNYIYFEKIYPLLQEAKNIKVFNVKDGVVSYLVQSKKAVFENNVWTLYNASLAHLPSSYVINKSRLRLTNKDELEMLRGFKPKILDTVYKANQSVNIVDALASLRILIHQNSSTAKLRAILYTYVIIPFFVPLVCIIIAYFAPILPRFSNLALVSFSFVVLALCNWGIFFVLSKLSIIGLLVPELGILLPLCLLGFVALHYLRRFS